MRYKIFISSVQKEFAYERRMLSNYLQKDAVLGRFFDVYVFEDSPAKDNTPEKTYIEEVKNTDVFLLLLGREYGYEFSDGTSPTQKEYETATKNNTENNTENLSKNQKRIINEIKINSHVTSEELSTMIGITADNIRVNLSKLKAKGLIERIGPDKGGYWKINVKNKS